MAAPPTSSSWQWTPNTKFGVFALDNCLEVELPEPIHLSTTASIYPFCPVKLPEHWRKWLGTLQTDGFEKADVAIVVVRPSTTPTNLDDETHDIHDELRGHFYGMLLSGIPDYRDGLTVLGGVNPNGDIDVKQVTPVNLAYRHKFGKRLRIDPGVAKLGGELGQIVLGLHDYTSHRRVRAGFKALVRAIEEYLPDERLHQYVRAVDGLMMLPKDTGQKEFIRRGPTFAKADKLPMLLEQLYSIRNTQEHLHDVHFAFEAPDEEEFIRVYSRRGYQAEQLALACYRRLLGTPRLLSQFETEGGIEAFWKLPADERQSLWGAPFDLDAAQKDHDYRYNLLKDY